MQRGQTTLEFLMIMGVALIILLVTISISNEQGSALSTRKAELQASLAATDIGNAAREVYAQGIGARKLATVTLPRSYNASQSGVYSTYLKIRAGRTDYIETFPFPVSGSLPGRPGMFEFLVENDGGTVSIGRWLAYANTSAIDATIYGGESYYESIALSSLSSTDSNVTVACTWEDGPVTIDCQNTSFALAGRASVPFSIGFSASEAAFGVHSGTVNVTVQGALGNQSIEIPVSVSIMEVYGELSSKITFLSPTPAKGTAITFAQLGVSPVVVNASISEISLSDLRYTVANSEYRYYDDSLVAMYNFDENPAIGESAGTLVDQSLYGNNASVYDSVRLLLHMDEADGNTTFDGSAYKNNGAIFGNTVALLHFDEGTGGTAYDESANRNNGTCVGMGSMNGANACSWTSGKNGSGIAFDGVQSYVSLGLNTFDSLYSGGNGKLAFEAWVKAPTSLDADRHYILNLEGWYVLKVQERRAFAFFTGSSASQVDSGVFLNDGLWHHVAASYNGTHQSIFVDGILRNSAAATLGNISSDNTLNVIGAAVPINSQFWNGSIDEVGIYSKALSADEVYAHYNASRARHVDWVVGRNGVGLQFDGIDDYVNTTYTKSSGDGTVSAWFKTTSQTSNSDSIVRPIVMQGDTISTGGIMIYTYRGGVSDYGKLCFIWGNTSTNVVTPSTYLDDNWHHIAMTHSGSIFTAYVDGVIIGSNVANDNPSTSTPFQIGGSTSNGVRKFNGTIDEVGVYDRTLTPLEIFEQFSQGRATHPESVTGVYGNALKFDGLDDYVQGSIPSPIGTGDYTLSAWYKLESGYVRLFSQTSNVNYAEMSFPFLTVTSNTIFVQRDARGSISFNYVSGNDWHQLVVKRANGIVSAYVDSVAYPLSVDETYGSQSGYSFNSTSFYLQRFWYGGTNYSYSGSVDEVRIWKRALSAAEVKQQYYSNLAKVSPDSWLFSSTHTQLDSRRYDYAIFAKDSNGQYDRASRHIYSTYNTIGFVPSTPNSGASESSASLLYDPLAVNASIANAALSQASISWQGANYSLFDSNLVAAYDFDNNAALGENSTLFVDSSNNGFNGTCSGDSCPSIVEGKYGKALYFDGFEDYVNLTKNIPSLGGTQPFAIEMWVNLSGLGPVSSTLISRYNYGVSSSGSYKVAVYTNGSIAFLREVSPFTAFGSSILTPNAWHHLVMGYNGTHRTIYVNGVLDYLGVQGSCSSGLNADVLLGAYLDHSSPTAFFDGAIDAVRIYNRSLSADEVALHYRSNIAKYAPGKWLLASNPATPAGAYSYAGFALDSEGWNSTGARSFSSVYNRIGFIAPTPANGSTANLTAASANGLPINVSVADANLSQLYLEWDGINTSFYDDSLVLAYNFDNRSTMGDTDERVTDMSRYGNAGGVASNALTLHFDEGDGAFVSDSGPNRINPVVYGDTVLLLRMNESTGSVAYDNSRFANNATCYHGAAIADCNFTSGLSDNAISFDGNSDHLRIPYAPTFNFTTAMSAFAWVKAGPQCSKDVMGQYQYDTNKRRWRIRSACTGSNNQLSVSLSADGTTNQMKQYTTVDAVFDNNWHHVGFTWASGALTLYVDGKVAQVSQSDYAMTSLYPSEVDFTIGSVLASNVTSENLLGLIDEVALYNRSLSASEVAGHYAARKAKFSEWDSNGRSGSAMNFDGIDDYVDLSANAAALELATGTLSLWFKASSARVAMALFGAGDTTTDAATLMLGPWTSTYHDESLGFYVYTSSSYKFSAFVRKGEQYYADGDWHQVAVVVGSSYNKIYVDGIEENLTYAVGNASIGSYFLDIPSLDSVSIARRGYPNNPTYFNGSIDEVAVTSRELTASEVWQSYAEGRPKHFDYADGKHGNALAFDGIDDYIRVSQPTFANLTMSAWVKPESASDAGIIGMYDNHGEYTGAFWYEYGNWYFEVGYDNVFQTQIYSPGKGVAGTWTHLLGTYNGTHVSLFVNGKLASMANETRAVGHGTYTCIGNVLTGCYSTASAETDNYFNGSIDEVRIWNRSMSAAEAVQHYYGNLAKHASDKWFFSTTAIANASGEYSYAAYLKDADGAWNSTGTRTVTVTNSTLVSFLSSTPADGSNVYSSTYPVRAAVVGVRNLSSFHFFANGAAYPLYDDSLLLSLSFDNVTSLSGNATREVDTSRYGNNGSITGSLPYVAGKYGQAAYFSGGTNYATVPRSASLEPASGLTVEAWVNPATYNMPDYVKQIVEKYYPDTSPTGYYLGMRCPDPAWATSCARGVFVFEVRNGTQYGSNYAFASNVTIVPNTWYHVVGTAGNGFVSIYVNGALAASRPFAGSLNYADVRDMHIGADYVLTSGRFWAGSIDEVRVWGRALSAGEVLSHYNSNFAKSAPDKWLFESTVTGVHPGVEELRVLARDSANNTYSDRRSIRAVSSQAQFSSPTPSEKRMNASIAAMPYYPLTVNATVSNISLANLTFRWGPSNVSLYNDSLVLAYNFDNVESNGDSAGVVKDVSRYGNNGAISGNTMILLHMDESSGSVIYDESKNRNNGTCYSGASAITCSFVAGISGTGLFFDGADDYADLGSSVPGFASGATLSAWIRTNSAADVMNIVSRWTAISGKRGPRIMVKSGVLSFQATTDGEVTTAYGLDGLRRVSDGKWHHVAATYDGSQIRLYVDGALDNSAEARKGILYSGSGNLVLGRQGTDSVQYFNGTIDEAAVYNRSLSASEVFDHYAAGKAKYADWTADGKYCGAMTFDGVDDSIQTNFNIGAQVRNMSFSAWVYARPTTGYSTIFSDGTTWTNGTRVWIDYNNQLMFYVANGTTYMGYQPVVKYGEYLNRWTHLAVSFEYFNNGSGVSSVYLNGQQLRYSFGTNGVPNPSNEKLVLGRIGTCCWNLNGMLDEVRLWNRTLSREEVDVVYRSSLNKFAPDKWLFSYSVPTDLAQVSYDYAVYANDFLADGADWGAYSGRKRITPFTDRISFIGQTPANTSSISSATAAFEPVQLNASIGNASLSQVTVNWNLTNLSLYDSSLVLMYNFDKVASIGDNASYVVDSSLYANNGTVLGMVNFSSDGPFGKAASFDGVWDYITAPSSTSLNFGTGDFAVAFWMKPVQFATSQGMVRKVAPETLWGDGWFIESTGDASNTIRFETRPNDAAIRSRRVNSSSAIPSGVWTYVTAVRAGAAMRIYLNGMLDAENATGVIDNVTSNASVIVGSSPQDSDRYFEGSIDEVRIWNRSLSSREVYESYAANLAHTGPGRWAFSANKSVAGVNGYSFYGFAGEPAGSNLTARTFSTSNNRIGFLSPTPADGSAIQSSAAFANGIQVNASVVNANLSAFKFNWNGTGAYYLDDNLVLAYNFDNAPAAGDSNERVTDYSRYRNNGTASSALLALHFDGENGSTAYDSAGGNNGVIYGDTLGVWNFDEAEGKSVSDKSRFANTGTVYGNTRLLLHFDEGTGSVTYDDSAFQNNATCYNMNGSTGITPCNWSIGKSGAGITFDGDDDYLNISNNNSLTMSTNDFTLEAWVKRNDNPADNPGIICKRNEGAADANKGYGMGVIKSGHAYGQFKPLLVLGDGTYYEDHYPSNSSDILPLGQWTHVAAVYSFASHSAQFYLNGVPVSTTKVSNGNITNLSESNPMLIGKANYLAYNLNGSLDEIGVYSKALPASEILAHYAAGKAKHSDWVAGKSGTGLAFDGMDDYVAVSSFSGNFTQLAVEAWVNVNNYTTNRKILDFGTGSTIGSRFTLQVGASYIDFDIDGGSRGYAECRSTPSGWVHLVGTWNRAAGLVQLYANGVLCAENTAAPTANSILILSSDPHVIGRRISATDYFNGSIDEVALYNRSLSADEVAVHYAAGRARLLERGEGRVGDCLVLNGTGEYLNIAGPVSALQVNSSFTFSGWIKPRKVGYTNPVIEWGAYYGGLQGIRVQQNNAGSLYGFAGSGSSRPMEYSDSVVPYDQWTHFAFQWNGTHLNMYINGVLQSAPSAFAGPLSYNGNYFYVGREGNNYFNGSLDEIALYNQSLSASEILQMYEEGVPKHLNYVEGKYGKAVEFDGATDYVSVPDAPGLNLVEDFSISAWVKTSSTATYQQIVRKDGGSPRRLYSCQVMNGKMRLNVYNGSTTNIYGNYSLNDGNWHFVTCVRSSALGLLYVDGMLDVSGDVASGSLVNSVPLTIGWDQYDDSAYFNGSIDEVRIWNRSLSASEIQQHYYSNLAKYAPDRWLFSSSQPIPSDGAYSFSASMKDTAGSWNSTGTRTVQVAQSNPLGFAPPTPADGSDLYGELVQVKGTLSNVSSLDTLKLLVGDSVTSLYDDSLVLAYNFDNVASLGETATVAVDVSRNGNNGILLNGTAWSSGKYGGGLAFDGANDFVLVNSSAYMFNSGSFSATVWANAAALDGGYDGLLSVDVAGDSAWKIKRDAGNTYFRGRYASTTLDYPQVNVDEWHQYGIVKSGTTLSIYFDGALVSTATCAATHALVGTSLVIGSYRVNDAFGGSHILNGSMDEVRIWNRSLSADEIRQQYDSNLAKFAPDKWLFQLNQSGLATRQYEVRAFARDLSNNSYSDRRFFNAYANKILFSQPTPIKRFFSTIGAGAAEPFAINASLRNISLSSMALNFNGTNISFYNDSLVLAYNFDDVSSIGDSATKVVDVSKYGNNGTIYGNTMLLLHMDENFGNVTYDESTYANNGTCYSAGAVASCTWVAGKNGTGIQFDGIDDYVNVPYSSNLNTTFRMTAAAWFRHTAGMTSYNDIVNRNYWAIQFKSGLNSQIGFEISNGSWNRVSGPSNTNDGNWHYVVGTYDKDGGTNNFRIYFDGVLYNQSTVTGAIVTSSDPLMVGAYSPGHTYYFNGSIDEVGVYNRSLSADEVLSHYNAGRVKHADWVQDGKWGSAMNFDGLDDYISAPDSDTLDLSSEFTISAWVNAPLQVMRTIASKQYSYAFQTYSWSSPMRDGLKLTVYNSTDNDQVWAAKTNYVQSGWKHVAVTFKNGESHFYYNGEHFYSSTKTIASANVNSNPLMIGTSLDGGLDEVRIWNRSLSADEMAQQYYGSLNKYAPDKWLFTSTQSNASATAGTYNYSLYSTDSNGQASSFSGRRVVFNDLNRIGFVSPSPASNAVISLAQVLASPTVINASIAGIASPREMKFNYDGTSTVIQNDSLVLAFNFDDQAAIGDSARQVTDTTRYGNNGTIYGNTLMLLHLDEGNGPTAFDEGIYANNGTCYNSSGARTCTWVQGKSGTGIEFDGNNDYISVGTSSALNSANSLTISVWVNLNNLTTQQTLWSNGVYRFSVGDALGGFSIFKTIAFIQSGVQVLCFSSNNILTRGWMHIAFTKDGNGQTNSIYVNGIAQPLPRDIAFTLANAGETLLGSYGGGYVLNGTLDEVMIANRSLSASEVLAQYNAGKAHHADWDPDGKWNSAMKFDGVGDFVNVSNSATLRPQEFTITAWVNPANPAQTGAIVAKAFNDQTWKSYVLTLYSGGRLHLELSTGLSGSPAGYPWWYTNYDAVQTGKYSFVAVTYKKVNTNGSDATFYVDGLPAPVNTYLANGDNATRTIVYSGMPLQIGRNPAYATPTNYFNGSIDEVRIWNVSLTAAEIQQQYYSNLAKYSPGKWVFSYAPALNSTGSHTFSASVRDDAFVLNTSETRAFTVSAVDKIAFIAPTPADGFNSRYGNITINASIANLSLSKMVFSWNGTNYSYLDSSLVLAMNFDDASAAGDTAGRSADYSNYGNNGTIYGNTMLLMHMDEADGNTTYDESRFASNGSIYGNTVALLHMDEASGSTVYDESAYKNNGTCTFLNGTGRACNWVVGKSGSGLFFDGNAVVYLGTPVTINTTRSVTVSAWVNLNDTDTLSAIYSKGYYYGTYHGIELRRHTDNYFHFFIGNGAAICNIRSDSLVVANTWYHVAGTFNGTNAYIYVNGVRQSYTCSILAPVEFEASMNSMIGAGAGSYRGTIDEFGLYNRSLTDAEILEQYNYGKAKHAEWATGKSGSGLQFDGIDDYIITTAAVPISGTQAFTLSGWIKPGAHSTYGGAAGIGSGNQNKSAYIGWTGISQVGTAYTIGGGFFGHNYGSGINDSNWHLVTFTFSGGTLGNASLYVDGVVKATDLWTPNITSTTMLIGRLEGTPAYPFNGTIDEVMVANRSLSAPEVLAQYNSGKAHHADWDPNGKWDGALKFDGVNDYLEVPHVISLAPTSQVTVEAWASMVVWGSSQISIVSKREIGGWSLYSDTVNFQYQVYRNGIYATLASPVSSLTSGWHHFVGTYDGRYAKLFIDGLLKITDDAGGTYPIGYSYNNALIMGADASSSSGPQAGTAYLNGSIDEVRIWNRALSADEVARQYYSNLQKVAPDRWIFTTSRNVTPTGGTAIPYSVWVRDDRTWATNESVRVINRQ